MTYSQSPYCHVKLFNIAVINESHLSPPPPPVFLSNHVLVVTLSY